MVCHMAAWVAVPGDFKGEGLCLNMKLTLRGKKTVTTKKNYESHQDRGQEVRVRGGDNEIKSSSKYFQSVGEAHLTWLIKIQQWLEKCRGGML